MFNVTSVNSTSSMTALIVEHWVSSRHYLGTHDTWSHLILLKLPRDFYTGKNTATQSSSEPEAFYLSYATHTPLPWTSVISKPISSGGGSLFFFFCLSLCLALALHMHGKCPFTCWVSLARGLSPECLKCLWSVKVWADAPVEAVSPSPHLILSACLSGCRSHVKLKAATDALFKVSSKMVLKCVTQLFHWCGQSIYGEVAFPLDRRVCTWKPL